jgi:hypothetical protein
MPRLAAETLVTAHEKTLDRWKGEKRKQFDRLAPPVREDPIYRPLAPTSTEESFYRERRACLQSFPRYRVREVYEARNDRGRLQSRRAVIEDTHRMGEFTGRVSDILRGVVDWPDDVIAFARKAIPSRMYQPRYGARSDGQARDFVSFRPPVTDLLSRSTLGNVSRIKRVDQYALYRAVDDLQRRVSERLSELVRKHGVEEYAADHVVIVDDGAVLANALAGYDDRTREAVALAHARSHSRSDRVMGTPLLVACSPEEIRSIHETEAGARDACDGSRGE